MDCNRATNTIYLDRFTPHSEYDRKSTSLLYHLAANYVLRPQLSVFLGPVLAGLIIAMFANQSTGSETAVPDLRGIGIAFAPDAVTFLASALTP
jgi:hypothetical protein